MKKKSATRVKLKINLKLYLLVLGISLAVVLSVFFIAFACGAFDTSEPVEEENVEISEDLIVPVDKATGKVNALILGVDKDGLRTDVIIIASYDLDDNKVNILSIPRDTRMYIGTRYQKINAAHAITQKGKIKGPQGTIEAVTRITGIPINYYVEFNFATFRNAIDVLGGVEFDVPRDMHYSDPYQDLYIDLKKGYQLLDGDKAEQLVRFRRYPEGDIARVRVQQDFLKSLCEQKLNVSTIKTIPDLFKQLSKDITTNVDLVDIMKYLPNVKDLSADSIAMYQLPGGYNDTDYGASYWICDISKTKDLIQDTFGYDASKITIHSSDGSSRSKDTKNTKATSAPVSRTESTKEPAVENKTPENSKDSDISVSAETVKSTESPSVQPSKPTSEPTAVPTVNSANTSEMENEKETDTPTSAPASPTAESVSATAPPLTPTPLSKPAPDNEEAETPEITE